MDKHTPGKWVVEVVGNSEASGTGADVCEIVTEDGHARIAEFVLERDAYVLSAAKDLLAALIELRDGVKDDKPEMWERVDAAIAKAEGK